MDTQIKKYLLQINLTKDEIKDIELVAPMISELTFEEFAQNCKLLIKYGYPKCDLDFLINANPNIFVLSNKDLEEDLKSLSKQYDNIELALKSNPFLI